jgi:hypothetical protein
MVSNEMHVKLVLGCHDLGNQQALEVPIVVLGDNDTRVDLAYVAKKVDPIAWCDQTELLRVRSQELRVVNDLLQL